MKLKQFDGKKSALTFTLTAYLIGPIASFDAIIVDQTKGNAFLLFRNSPSTVRIEGGTLTGTIGREETKLIRTTR